MLLIEALLRDMMAYMDLLLSNLVPLALFAEQIIDQMLGFEVVSELYNILFSFGISLIILKFIKKGFDTYILWTDGDADADPILFTTYFLKALVVAISFPTLYGWMAIIVQDKTNELLSFITNRVVLDWDTIIDAVLSKGLFTAIMGVVFLICLIYLYIKFLQTGLEILLLRLGIPLACVGLVDSDGGVFKTYIQKFFQTMFTVIIQIVLLKLGLALIITGHLIWATAVIFMAIRTPKFLQEFIIVAGGSGGAMNKAYQGVRMFQMVRSMVR